jgi:hypothetical protein
MIECARINCPSSVCAVTVEVCDYAFQDPHALPVQWNVKRHLRLLYAQQNDTGEVWHHQSRSNHHSAADSFSNINFSMMASSQIHCISGSMLFSHIDCFQLTFIRGTLLFLRYLLYFCQVLPQTFCQLPGSAKFCHGEWQNGSNLPTTLTPYLLPTNSDTSDIHAGCMRTTEPTSIDSVNGGTTYPVYPPSAHPHACCN